MSGKFRLKRLTSILSLPILMAVFLPYAPVAAKTDYVVHAADLVVSSVVTTNDPFFTNDPTAADYQWYLPKIGVPQAWNYTKGSSTVVVAIIDTGILASHLDLSDGRVGAGYDFVNNKPIPANTDSDDNGHGTAVAGVIGAIPNNGKGITGIDWNINLMPIKALDSSGTGQLSAISNGIKWATDHGANIINLSLGANGFPEDPDLASAISYAFNKGAVIVAAAGNDTAAQGINLDQNPGYPVCADNGQNMVIGVAASDINDRKADFSNFGINCVDITAPGKRIITTGYLPSSPSNNILIYGSGTSLATPVVSGVAALIKSEHPDYTNIQIRDTLLKTTDNIDSLNTNNCLNSSCTGFLGKGRINALRALAPQPVLDQSLVRELSTGNIYYVSGGVKQYVSQFVYNQKFPTQNVMAETNNQLSTYTLGSPILPKTGTLIRSASDPTVYYVDQNVIRPLTYLLFQSRNFSFAQVQILPDADVALYPKGDWYWPPEGTMVVVFGNPTVYVMHNDVARPVTYFVFTQRKLSFARVLNVTADDFSHVPKAPDNFWLAPLDGTLVKSVLDPTVYVVSGEAKHALSAKAFLARGYKFTDIKTFPQAWVDVIAPGDPIL